MSTSHKIKEDEGYIYLYKYLHDEPDEIADWWGGQPDVITEADNYATYEVRLNYRIKKSNAEVIFDSLE